MSDPTKDPSQIQWLSYAFAAAFAMLGGLVSFAQKVRAGKSKWINAAELIGELVSSAFAGILVLLICEHFKFDVKITGALVGISGWMGTRALYLLESFLAEKFGIKHAPGLGDENDHPKRRASDLPATKYDPDPGPVTAAERAVQVKQMKKEQSSD